MARKRPCVQPRRTSGPIRIPSMSKSIATVARTPAAGQWSFCTAACSNQQACDIMENPASSRSEPGGRTEGHMGEERGPDRSAAAVVAVVLGAFILACGGLVLLIELLEGNLT